MSYWKCFLIDDFFPRDCMNLKWKRWIKKSIEILMTDAMEQNLIFILCKFYRIPKKCHQEHSTAHMFVACLWYFIINYGIYVSINMAWYVVTPLLLFLTCFPTIFIPFSPFLSCEHGTISHSNPISTCRV